MDFSLRSVSTQLLGMDIVSFKQFLSSFLLARLFNEDLRNKAVSFVASHPDLHPAHLEEELDPVGGLGGARVSPTRVERPCCCPGARRLLSAVHIGVSCSSSQTATLPRPQSGGATGMPLRPLDALRKRRV